MLIEKDYCDKETAFALQELGYNPYMFYDDGTPAIHLWHTQKWLREEKHIDALVYLDDLKGYFPFIRIWEGSWKTFISLAEMEDKKVSYFVNYEEALSEGIKKAVKILKEK
jgi:hypothetical protein